MDMDGMDMGNMLMLVSVFSILVVVGFSFVVKDGDMVGMKYG